MSTTLQPAIWLIVLIVGLPQLSETVYSPSLPDIALSLRTSESMVEYTLTIYLLGFAIGTLFWGHLSDRVGRKPCIVAGLAIFVLGSIGCQMASDINMLLFSRLVQAFGGSIGSVLGQAICRDAFYGPALGQVYSAMSSAIALFPALGPVCGGLIAQHLGWRNIFVFLSLFAVALTILVATKLPETHHKHERQPVSAWALLHCLMTDKKVLAFGFLVAGCNGIMFSYFAEGSFYFINGLGLSPSTYGLSFIGIAIATMMGGIVSHNLQAVLPARQIIQIALAIMGMATALWSAFALVDGTLFKLSNHLMIAVAVLNQMIVAFGICMTTSNALALALVDYKHAIGTASSLFGFYYYGLISLFTLGMALLHNGTLLPMPFYFLGLSLLMIGMNQCVLSVPKTVAQGTG